MPAMMNDVWSPKRSVQNPPRTAPVAKATRLPILSSSIGCRPACRAEICTRLRAEDATRMLPIIILSARGEEVLRLRGFSAGADDFVVKPFSMRELIARVRALLRRSRLTIADHPLTRGDLQLDHQTRRVRRGARRPSQADGIPAGDLDQC
jgi:DNA-binding NarL/FixJ family response regulator